MLSDDIRKRIINSYLTGHSKKEIAAVLNVKVSSVYAVIGIYLKEGRIESKLKGGPRRKALSDEHVRALKEWIDEDASSTLDALRTKLINTFGVTVSTTTVNNYIDSFSYSFKRITLIPVRRNDEESIDARFNYAQKFLQVLSNFDESKLLFVDEIGFSISLRSREGRSLKGTRAVQMVPGLRTRNISVCCSMSKLGVIKYQVQTTPYNTITFGSFIDSLLAEINGRGSHVIIMDNVPFHKSQQIREAIEEKDHQLIFLPPYSPFMNPIENMFAKWKQSIRQARPSNEVELLALIDNVVNIISSDDCSACYRHMMGFISKCINKEIIINE